MRLTARVLRNCRSCSGTRRKVQRLRTLQICFTSSSRGNGAFSGGSHQVSGCVPRYWRQAVKGNVKLQSHAGCSGVTSCVHSTLGPPNNQSESRVGLLNGAPASWGNRLEKKERKKTRKGFENWFSNWRKLPFFLLQYQYDSHLFFHTTDILLISRLAILCICNTTRWPSG